MNNDLNYIKAKINSLEDIIRYETLTDKQEFSYRQQLDHYRLKEEYLQNRKHIKHNSKEILKYISFLYFVLLNILIVWFIMNN